MQGLEKTLILYKFFLFLKFKIFLLKKETLFWGKEKELSVFKIFKKLKLKRFRRRFKRFMKFNKFKRFKRFKRFRRRGKRIFKRRRKKFFKFSSKFLFPKKVKLNLKWKLIKKRFLLGIAHKIATSWHEDKVKFKFFSSIPRKTPRSIISNTYNKKIKYVYFKPFLLSTLFLKLRYLLTLQYLPAGIKHKKRKIKVKPLKTKIKILKSNIKVLEDKIIEVWTDKVFLGRYGLTESEPYRRKSNFIKKLKIKVKKLKLNVKKIKFTLRNFKPSPIKIKDIVQNKYASFASKKYFFDKLKENIKKFIKRKKKYMRFYKKAKFRILKSFKKKYSFKKIMRKNYNRLSVTKAIFASTIIFNYIKRYHFFWLCNFKKDSFFSSKVKYFFNITIKINDRFILFYINLKNKMRFLLNFKLVEKETTLLLYMKNFYKQMKKILFWSFSKRFITPIKFTLKYTKSRFKYKYLKTRTFIKFKFLLKTLSVIKYFLKLNKKKNFLHFDFIFHASHSHVNEKFKKIRRK